MVPSSILNTGGTTEDRGGSGGDGGEAGGGSFHGGREVGGGGQVEYAWGRNLELGVGAIGKIRAQT